MLSRLPILCCAMLASFLIGCESTSTATKASSGAGGASLNVKSYARAHGPVRVVRTTAYHCKESDHIQYGSKSAYGTTLRYGKVRSAAADWSRYPVGTVFRIKGLPHLFIIDDYGSALVGKDTIDLYTRSQQEMNYWGVRHVQVEFLRWGSYETSYQLLSQRLKYPHCRQMAMSIRAKRPSAALASSRKATRSGDRS